MFFIFVICGILTAIPFVFPTLWLLNWVSLVPLIYVIMRHGYQKRYIKLYFYGLGFGLGFYCIIYHWFVYMYPMDFMGLDNNESKIVIAICWFGLALIQALEFGFLPVFYKFAHSKSKNPYTGAVLNATLFIILWVIFEFQQTLFWRGIPWARLAVSQYRALFVLQSASLLGSIFVSALVVAVNACFSLAIYYSVVFYKNKRFTWVISSFYKEKAVRLFVIIGLSIFTLNAVFGILRIAINDEKKGDSITVAVVQGNISSTDKWADESLITSLNLYLRLSQECIDVCSAKVIVWPETVIPVFIKKSVSAKNKIINFAKENDVIIITGIYDSYTDEDTDESHEYNSIAVFYPDGTVGDELYHKRKPVPFGETVPMEGFIFKFIPLLADMNLLGDSISPGDKAVIFDTEYGSISPLVCFDSIYETLTTEAVRNGASVMTVSANDSWFGDSSAARQHNAHSMLRAIESNRYFIRSANTGISSIISSEGNVLAKINPSIEGYTYADIYFNTSRTLYSYIGNLFVYLCIAGYGGFVCLKYVNKYKNKKTFDKS